MTPYQILLVEDDDDTRNQTRAAINRHLELQIIGAAASCEEARRCLASVTPQAVLLDLGLPDGSGVDLIPDILRAAPAAEIMVCSAFGDESHVVNAIQAGACGYVLKDASARELCQSIIDMRAGGSPISAAVARHVLRRIRTPAAAPVSPAPSENHDFTERELEVLQIMAKGYSYQEIADSMQISINTVREYVRRIYRKLAVRSRGEAVFEARASGLL